MTGESENPSPKLDCAKHENLPHDLSKDANKNEHSACTMATNHYLHELNKLA